MKNQNMPKSVLNIKIALVAAISFNLLTSITAYSQSSASTDGSISIEPCPSDCLLLNVPPLVQFNDPFLITADPDQFFFFAFNYNLGQQVQVVERRGLEDPEPGFNLDVEASDIRGTTNLVDIDYSNLGILTFNNDATVTTDSNDPDPTVLAPLDQDVTFDDFTLTLPQDPTADTLFTFFPGSTPGQSDPIRIIEAPTTAGTPGRYDTYSLGLGFIIDKPAGLDLTTVEDDYILDLDFTLSSTT